MACAAVSRAIDAEAGAVQPTINLHREPGVLDRIVQIAKSPRLTVRQAALRDAPAEAGLRRNRLLHQAGDYAAFNFQPLPLQHPAVKG
jgi:hypothetical protein